MKHKLLFGVIFTLLVIVYQTFAVAGQTDIGVSNADATLKPTLASSAELETTITTVATRLASEFSDGLRLIPLAPPESALQTILQQVTQRASFDFAQGSRVTNLQFPKELVNDTTSPQISGTINAQSSGNNATLAWSTTEFTTAILRYGIQSGNYTDTQSATRFAKQHAMTLPNILSGTTLFFQITLTDLSSNTFTIPEQSLTIMQNRSVYLPLISR